MPIYEYECKHCGETWEALVGVVQNTDSKRCPHCLSEHITKLFNSTLADMVYTQEIPEGDRQALLNNKKYYESPEVQKRIRSGEMDIKENGPREFRPKIKPRFT